MVLVDENAYSFNFKCESSNGNLSNICTHTPSEKLKSTILLSYALKQNALFLTPEPYRTCIPINDV